MTKFLLTLNLLIVPSLSFSFTPYTAYLDNLEEDDSPISVFKTPGQNWKYCQKEMEIKSKKLRCIDAVGWPSRDAKITVLEPSVEYPTKDPLTNKDIYEEYTKIEFEYSRVVNGKTYYKKEIGYIESYYLSKKPSRGFYAPAQEKKEPCPPATSVMVKEKKEVAQLKSLTVSVENYSVSKKAEELSKYVGFCPLKPPTEPPNQMFDGNVYDALILPKLTQQKIPSIAKEDGSLMSHKELVEIDALARTIYGEMAQCFRRGLHYPMAVAKIILNRSEDKARRSEFIKPPHAENKPDLAKVCTSPSQFSMWRLQKDSGKNNEPLHHGLCPPVEKNKPYWNSDQASSYEADVWKNTMRIATEAVLHPKQFKKRTEEIDGYFYSSGLAHKKETQFFKNMSQHFPSIEGRKVDRGSCVEIWKE